MKNSVPFEGHFCKYAFGIRSPLELLTEGIHQIIRQTSRQNEQVALELLDQVANNLRVVVISVHKFALWWSDAETMTYNLENQNISGDGQRLSSLQIDMARNNWGAVEREYVKYKTSVSNMWFPLA
jgi:hypothetical protein